MDGVDTSGHREKPHTARIGLSKKQRDLIILCHSGGLFGLIAFCFYIVGGVPITPALITVLALTSAYFVMPQLMRTSMSLRAIGILSFLWLELILFITAFNFGGYSSPSMPWFTAVPILAYYYLRGNDRIAVLGVFVFGLAALAVVDLYGIGNRWSAPPTTQSTTIYLTSTLFALFFIGTITHVFTTLSERHYQKLKTLKNEAEEKQREAEWANSAKTQFLANMSHELRTPLNAIIGFSDFVRSQAFGPIGNPKYTEYNEDIHNSAQHLHKLIDDILAYSRLESGKLEIYATLVDVSDLTLDVFKQVGFRPESDALLLERSISDSLPLLSADERLLKQILINVLVNALKFTPPGGRVSLNADLDNFGGIQLTVSDTGIGIPARDLKGLTKPFVKSSHGRTITEEGAGLGLALVQEFMTLHQGTLDIESNVNMGTVVTCTFPAWRSFNQDTIHENALDVA